MTTNSHLARSSCHDPQLPGHWVRGAQPIASGGGISAAPAGSQVSRVPAQRTPPDQSASPVPLPVPQRPPRRLRTALTVVAGVLALLCVGGGVAGYVLYERAATPDRSAPDVVVDNYLREFLVNENDTRAELLVCKGSLDGLAEMRALRDDLRNRERRFATTLTISWGRSRRNETVRLHKWKQI